METGEIISVPILEVGVVSDGLPGVDIEAVEDFQHQDLYGQDKEVASHGVP